MMETWVYDDRRYRQHARMKLGSVVGAIGSTIGGIMGAGAASDAATAQQNASQNAQNTLNTANQGVQQNYQPYQAAGTSALSKLTSSVTNPTAFNMSDFMSDPGYQFTLQQGQNAINSSAAAKGNALSGGTLKAQTQYATGLANTTYGDAYNRYLATSQQNYNQLAGVAGLGLNATNSASSADLGTASGVANLQTQAGNAQAAGIIGQQNAYNGIINGVSGAANQYSFNNSMKTNPLTAYGMTL
jgi:hypothetical protein